MYPRGLSSDKTKKTQKWFDEIFEHSFSEFLHTKGICHAFSVLVHMLPTLHHNFQHSMEIVLFLTDNHIKQVNDEDSSASK